MPLFRKKPETMEIQQPNEDDNSFRLGPLLITFDDIVNHIMLFGATGAGKTSLIRIFCQDVVPLIGDGRDYRLLMNNPKGDAISILHGIAPSGVRIVNTDPFDDRGVAWDMYKDICEPRTALQLAFTLIPKRNESQPFFSDAARHLVYGALVSFIHRKLEWKFADLVRAVRTGASLRRVLSASRYTRHLVQQYLYEKRLASNIISTIATAMLPFEPVAACWESAREAVSIEDWTRESWILLLGSSDEESVRIINRCMFKRASDLVLRQSESFQRRSFFIIDEVSESGKLDGLVSLLKRGRSKGAAVLIAAQSVAGLRATELYGPHGAAEVVGQIMHKVFGRLECHETAKWASDVFGQQEVTQITRSTSRSTGGQNSSTTRSTNEHVVTQATVLPSQFMSIPPCNLADGLSAYYISGNYGAFAATLAGPELFQEDLIPPSSTVQDFVPRPVESQYLEPWTKEQAERFAPRIRRKAKRREGQQQSPKRPRRDMLDELSDL